MQPDDDDFDDDQQPQQTQAPKALRQHVSKLEKENQELRKQLDKLAAEQRKRTVGEALTAKGMNPKLAGLVPADVETPEAVDKWLADYADLFPVAKQETPQAPPEGGGEGEKGQESGGEADEFETAMNRMSEVVGKAQTPGREADMLALVNSAKSREDLDRLIAAAGGGYGSG